MTPNAAMLCPQCGMEMNHHGDKLVYTSEGRDSEFGDGEVIAEFYSCPKCGRGAQREL